MFGNVWFRICPLKRSGNKGSTARPLKLVGGKKKVVSPVKNFCFEGVGDFFTNTRRTNELIRKGKLYRLMQRGFYLGALSEISRDNETGRCCVCFYTCQTRDWYTVKMPVGRTVDFMGMSSKGRA